jgi:quercetin dioxygenase-like cupin family protein
MVTDGVGYHQIKGEPVQIVRKGDVVKCPPNTIHWHGASKEKSMTHIYILPNTETGEINWMEKVTDEQYGM